MEPALSGLQPMAMHLACSSNFEASKYALGRLSAWHLPGGPVGPPARWAASPNVGGGGMEEGALGPFFRDRGVVG